MERLRISLFGAFQVSLDGEAVSGFKSQKVRALLAYLATEADRAHSRDTLASLLWPDWPDNDARKNLRYALYNLRNVIQDSQAKPSFLIIQRDSIQFNLSSLSDLDFSKFQKLIQDDKISLPAPENWKQALAIYRGEFLEGFTPPESLGYDEWMTNKRAELERQRFRVVIKLACHYENLGDYSQALEYARKLVDLEPWQEEGHRQLMRLLVLSGERGTSLRHYEQYRQQLHDELSVEPDKQTEELYERIQSDEKFLQIPAHPTPPDTERRLVGGCPYRGLSAFREEDARFFFGREAYIEQLLDNLTDHRALIMLVGASGSGKSSILQAGLLPRLRLKQNWLVAAFRPAEQPFLRLASALIPWLEPEIMEIERLVETQKLANSLQEKAVSLQTVILRVFEKNPDGTKLLLLCDQFEELYTQCPDLTVQHAFIDTLLSPVWSQNEQRDPLIRLVLTLRADFMGKALEYRPLTDALQHATQILGPMSKDELRAAIEKPAQLQDANFEEGLVARILDDIGTHPGNLPLLEFALQLLWEKSSRGVLTHAAYEQIGGVKGALTCYAEEVYTRLDQKDRENAKRIFMQMVQPGLGTDDTRRVSRQEEIGEANWALTQYLADQRLVVTDRGVDGTQVAEIIHEALIQQWQRFRDWIETDRSFRVWQETLRVNIRQWEAAGQDPEATLRGIALAQAEEWCRLRESDLSALEIAFIQASIAERERHERALEQQRQAELEKARAMAAAERRSRRFLGALAGVLAVAVLITIVLTAFANQQRQQALSAYSLSLAANAEQALTDLDSGTALSLALAANQVNDPPLQAQRVLVDAAYAPGARQREPIETLFPGAIGPATSLAISLTGDKVLLGLADGNLVIWKPDRGEYQVLKEAHTQRVNDVAIAPDGLTGLSVSNDHQVIYWDLESGRAIYRLGEEGSGHSGDVRAVDISADGRIAVSGGLGGQSITNPGELILWDLTSGKEIRRFSGHINGVVDAKFTPDGQKILSSSGDMEMIINDETATGEVATHDLLLWEVTSGRILMRYEGLGQDVYALAIRPDDQQALLASYYNNTIVVLDLISGQILQTLTGHNNAVRSVSYLPDGQQALSSSDDGNLILWNLVVGKPRAVLRPIDSPQLDLAISSNGRKARSVSLGGDLFEWDLQNAAVIQQFGAQKDVPFDVAFSPDGKTALSCAGSPAPDVPAQDASLKTWDLQTGRLLQSMTPDVQVNYQCAISPDGRWALSAAEDGYARLWDLTSGQQIARSEGFSDWVISLAFSPDGKKALIGAKDGTLNYWDLEKMQVIQRMFSAPTGNWCIAISPDGKTAISDASQEGAILWNLETGLEIRHLVRKDTSSLPGSSGCAYLPDGQRAITGENDGYLIEWDLNTGQEIRRFGRHDDIRTRVEISADGKTFLTSGMNGTLRLWDYESGELIREFGYNGPAVVFDIAISPDGQTALSGSIDQRLTWWSLARLTLNELMDWIRANRYVRELTCAERASYQIEPLCLSSEEK